MRIPMLFGRFVGSLRSSKGSEALVPVGRDKTVLMAWELGGGMGHINRLIPVAHELKDRGFRVAFTLRSRKDARGAPTMPAGTEILRAPAFYHGQAKVIKKISSSYNYSDILFGVGYASQDSLEPLIAAWQAIFDLVKPSLVVCDYSPTVILAAAGAIPVVHIGSGFATPPARQPLLPLNLSAIDGAADREARVLKTISEIRRLHGRTAPKHVSDMFSWAECFACTLPELDPYCSVRTAPAIGPIHYLPCPAPPAKRPFVFGYLAADGARVPEVLQSLARSKINCGLFIRQAPRAWHNNLKGTTVKLFDEPQRMEEALGNAVAVLHHGGVNTTETALAIGRPQFLLPRYLEQTLTADTIEKMGCGVNLNRQNGDIGELIQRCVTHDEYMTNALRAALMIANRPAADVKAMIVAACLKHLV